MNDGFAGIELGLLILILVVFREMAKEKADKTSLTRIRMWTIMWIIINRGEGMKTIQMTIDEPLLNEVDSMIKSLSTTRSAFIREALKLALRHHKILALEQQHAGGYAQFPVEAGEFDGWEDEQVWGEA
jgi:Arc/MetJ-type ribon-helix-helix transcriptional regulator